MDIFNRKISYKIVCVLSFLLLSLYSSVGYAAGMNYAEEEFEKAWNNANYTQIKLDDININKVLDEHYETLIPVNFTRQMLWDMETKKAWDPKTYIPYVVRDGQSWGRELLENGDEVLVRSSQQKQWLNGEVYEEVFEEVYLNHKDQIATFIGTQNLRDSFGESLHLENQQPLFYIQHSVGGEESNPLNVWRIVHLTEGKDLQLIEHFKKLKDPTKLPGFVEIYIENDLQIPLSHK